MTVADVIQAIDGPLNVTACSPNNHTCEQFENCGIRDPLWKIKEKIVEALATVTVAEMVPEPAVPPDAGRGAGQRAPTIGRYREGQPVDCMDATSVPRPVYLDHHATTPVDPRVLQAMLPYFKERFGNAANRHYRHGWEADEAVEGARQQVASLIGARAKEIVFTGGATEANNLAIRGACRR